ncbi:Uncharacterised protein [Shigella dysenteriae]|nr:Uncharacterised protein [Shigella dysenteriae]
MLNHQGQLQPVAIASDIFLHLNGFMFHGLVVKFDAIIRRFYMVFVVFYWFSVQLHGSDTPFTTGEGYARRRSLDKFAPPAHQHDAFFYVVAPVVCPSNFVGVDVGKCRLYYVRLESFLVRCCAEYGA